MRLRSMIGRHYGRPSCNELIIPVSLVSITGYYNKSRITISYGDSPFLIYGTFDFSLQW